MKNSLKTKLSTPRYQETKAFYEAVLGMEIVEEWNEPGDVGAILAFPGGCQEAFLEVYEVDDQKKFDGLSLQFRVDSIAEFIAALSGTIEFEGPTDRPWGSKYLSLCDPNNIQVVIFEGGF